MSTKPLSFQPLLKQTIWGGRRLGTMLNKPIGDATDYAESWEIVDHGDDQSVVVDGPHEGQTLAELFASHREWLMGTEWVRRNPAATSFPLLLKYLDCNRVLSVQVHPNDAYGATMDPPDLGKTEAWLILHSDPESVIYAGLKSGVDQETLSRMIANGKTEDALHSYHPDTGDCVFIPAGTVHALGGGLVVAEIQQSSNTTFRLFDWNRVDASGQSRPLHIEQSLAVTDYEAGPVNPIRMPPVAGVQTLVQCDKFDLRRFQSTKVTLGGDDRCHLLTLIAGEAILRGDQFEWNLTTGQSVLLPASMSATECSVEGDSIGLWMSPPGGFGLSD